MAMRRPSPRDDVQNWWRYADHLEAEVDRLQLALIEAQNPGIDLDEVRALRALGKAGL